MNIYLIGMMGSGKSTVGLALSKYLNYQFVDIDMQIEQTHQMPIRQIFEQLGEDAFRKIEAAMLKQCEAYHNTVIATGGGVVEYRENRDYLSSQCTIFLRGGEQVLWQRVKDDTNRPLAVSQSLFQKRYEIRKLMYEESAAVVIDIDDKTVKDIVAEILFHLFQKKGVVNR